MHSCTGKEQELERLILLDSQAASIVTLLVFRGTSWVFSATAVGILVCRALAGCHQGRTDSCRRSGLGGLYLCFDCGACRSQYMPPKADRKGTQNLSRLPHALYGTERLCSFDGVLMLLVPPVSTLIQTGPLAGRICLGVDKPRNGRRIDSH